ncbi:biliverdin-producing heme oxygenase [Corticibacterium sp. UT-5YL-CI-8]|nr:biliverdin-producing heme oxygenase [Tianweitania sp. UT-5YL-CI-8]
MNSVADIERPIETSRWKVLKARTAPAHERLDKRIMAGNPFADRDRYGMFVTVQHHFHRDIDALYSKRELDRLLPDLAGRRRLGLIEQDLADLGLAIPQAGAPLFCAEADIPTALGWLYVAEGSNLGAAFLLKEAAKLGLSETFGARHLAGAPEGRGLHWRTFTAALDALELDAAEEQKVVDGGDAAFRRVHDLVAEIFG